MAVAEASRLLDLGLGTPDCKAGILQLARDASDFVTDRRRRLPLAARRRPTTSGPPPPIAGLECGDPEPASAIGEPAATAKAEGPAEVRASDAAPAAVAEAPQDAQDDWVPFSAVWDVIDWLSRAGEPEPREQLRIAAADTTGDAVEKAADVPAGRCTDLASNLAHIGYEYVPLLQARANEVEMLTSGRLRLPLLQAPENPGVEAPDLNFDHWMQGGPGIAAELPAQSFFIDYDDADTSISAFGKTYGPQRKPGDPYTLRPFLAVFQRKDGSRWVREDFMANFEVRYWDYELAYVSTVRPDAGIAIGAEFLGADEDGSLRYAWSWMQTVPMEVVLPASGGPLLVTSFNGAALVPPTPLFRLRSGYDLAASKWYLAPLPPRGHEPPPRATFNIGFRSSMRMLSAYLQQ